MQIHELNSRTPTDTDEMALDTGSQTYKTRVGLLKPQFVSYDRANPTSWENVPLITGNSSIVFVFERLTRMFGNIRYLWKLIGSGDFSNVSETISGAIGNTALTTTATSLSGAIAEHEEDISTINGNLSTTSLTRTWVDNNYIDQTSFNRTYAHKYGKLVCIFLNVVFTSSMPTGTSDVVIGKITGMTLGRSFFFLVPSQSNNSTCLFQLRSNGELWVSNLSGTATGTSWFRTTLVALEGC